MLQEAGEEIVLMDVNPTAENIAHLIFLKAQESWPEVLSVRLWETTEAYAEFTTLVPKASEESADRVVVLSA